MIVDNLVSGDWKFFGSIPYDEMVFTTLNTNIYAPPKITGELVAGDAVTYAVTVTYASSPVTPTPLYPSPGSYGAEMTVNWSPLTAPLAAEQPTLAWPSEADTEINADLLDKAADLIEQLGWAQHAARSATGEICAGQAVNDAVLSSSITHGIYSVRDVTRAQVVNALLLRHLAAEGYRNSYGTLFESVPAWNDAPERTKDEVINALRKAAIAERERVV